MSESFTNRMGIQVPIAEIITRNDAPDGLRNYLLIIMKQYCGLMKIREIVCMQAKEAPDPNNWKENEYMYCEVQGLIMSCPWYRIYDIIEQFYKIIDVRQKPVFEERINEFFFEKGIGWKLNNGLIEIRGDETFESAISEIEAILDDRNLKTSKTEIKEAISDLSRRPNPEVTGAVQHSLTALECLSREITGSKDTLGTLIKNHPEIVPPPLDTAISKIFGFASNQGRHLNEGGEPAYEEAELLVHLSASICSYLCKKHIKIDAPISPWE